MLNMEFYHLDPEVRAHVYQTLAEFQPYVTPTTMITVTYDEQQEIAGEPKTFQVTITLQEAGSKLAETGEAEDLLTAITEAKNRLLKNLSDIHNEVMSQKDRMLELQFAMRGAPQIH